ncbi:MAG: hypothetical protein U7126_03465 [Microcoleus sp.]
MTGGQKPGFCEILGYSRRFGRKTRFLGAHGWWPETGFLRDTWLQSQIWEKNPVSWSSRVVARNRVFARYLVTVANLGEKPGFLELTGGGQKPGFCEILGYSRKFGRKTRFLGAHGWWPETGFLRDTWLQSQIWEKNPVSWSSRVVTRNRVFARYLVTVADLGEKPGFLELTGGGQKPFVVVFPPQTM